MREEIEGTKKTVQEPHAIKDPKTGEIIVPSKTIKAIRLHYCVETLQNNDPYKVYKELIKQKKDLHEKRMTETGCEVCITNEDFKDNISRFKAKQTKTYDGWPRVPKCNIKTV